MSNCCEFRGGRGDTMETRAEHLPIYSVCISVIFFSHGSYLFLKCTEKKEGTKVESDSSIYIDTPGIF